MISATEALERLREGNDRFVRGERLERDFTSRARRREVLREHKPFAILLGCSDARVPAEIVFDQGLGDLFVVRVAGNIAAPSQIASIEFSAEQLGTQLVVVLGHSNCGAIKATLDEIEHPGENRSSNIASIVDHIRPAIETLASNPERIDRSILLQESMRANVRASVEQLHGTWSTLGRLVENGRLKIVGAEYSIESGKVGFL